MEQSNRLGDFLRAQREKVTPEQAGMPVSTGRRVPGLRREEVAVLAGVSVDYYTRLEQGRERSPSAQVVDALAQALGLAPDAREHAFRLARLSPTAPTVTDVVEPELLQMMDAVGAAAAYVTNPAFRVLRANPIATALIAPVDLRPNMISTIFLEPLARAYYGNWDQVGAAAVSALRHSAGFTPQHPEVAALIASLSAESPEFAALWNNHEVTGLSLTRKTIHHPAAGTLHLNYQTFDVRTSPGQQLTVATAEPGSPSALALAQLTISSLTM